MSDSRAKITSVRTVAKTRIFTVEEVECEYPNGAKPCFERVIGRAKEAVLVIPMLDAETILLIREYAVAAERYVLGFPKGAMENPQEDILVCANRELMEEVGYGARDLRLLKSMYSSPGYVVSLMHYVLAKDLYPQKLVGDEPEPIEIIPWKLNNLKSLVAHSEFCESRSLAALALIA